MNSLKSTKKQSTPKINPQPLIEEQQTHEINKDPSLNTNIKPSSYGDLFYFADKIDWILMAFAILFSLGNGVSIVFYSIPLKQLINAFSTTSTKDEIVKATVNSVYGFLINSGIVFINCWLMTAAWTITSQRQMNKARKQYFEALLRQQISWHDQIRPAQACSKMYIQVAKVQQGLVTNMTAVLTKISMGISGIFMAIRIGYQMAFVMILFLPIMMISGCIRGHFTKEKQMYAQTKKVKVDSDVIEVFDNIKTVKMLAGESYQIERYQKNLAKQKQANWSHGWKGSLAFTFFFFCIIANYALGFWYGTKVVTNQTINKITGQPYNVAQVVTIFFTLYISNMNLSGLPDSIASFSVSRYSMAKILAIIKRTPKMHDGILSFPRKLQSISFNNVSFKYDDKPLFESLNLKISKGITALMGESGCGKSTIVSLIMKFYDVQKGQIIFQDENRGSININDLRCDGLREKVGYVGQEPVLIGKNIREVLMAQNYPDNQVFSILEVVKADSFVRDIGLHSELKSVSGGQKQRLAIARALLKKPKVLILDQSTSALDQKTEQQVLTKISNLGINFIIMVAHRQQTLIYADRIVKINKDKIQFEGTYNQMLQKGLIRKLKPQIVDEERKSQQKQKLSKMQKELEEINHKIEISEHGEEGKEKQQSSNRFGKLTFKWKYLCNLISLNKDKWEMYLLGTLGAIYFGCIFPAFSYLISRIILILQSITTANDQTFPYYYDEANWLAAILFLISFGSLIFTTFRWVCFEFLNEQIGYKVKLKAFGELISRPYHIIQQDNPQSYAYMINKNCEDLKPLAGNHMPAIIENSVTLIVGLSIAFAFSWQITAISLVILPLILLSSKMMMSFNHGMQSNTDDIHKKNHELVIVAIMNLKTVRSCQLEKPFIDKYAKELDGALKYSIKYGNLAGVLFGVGQTLISCTFASIFLAGSYLIKAELTSVQDIYTAIFAVMFAGVQAGGNLYFLGQLQVAKIGACIYYQNIIRNQTQIPSFISDESELEATEEEGANLKIENITFEYPIRPIPIFKNFSLTVKKNEKIALVGQSGSGKSTLTSLLFKLYEPSMGKISINGHEIHNMHMNKISKAMGIVMQEPALFNRSVYENLKYNNTEATFEDLKQACKAAKAYDFIEKGNFGVNCQEDNLSEMATEEFEGLSKGFQKSVGPRGSFLSGGQKQRLSIARALARKPKILILDEATSALDPQNQKAIQETIQSVSNITQIIIAHRLSTIVNCDRIVVLKNGQILEQGTYKQLIKNGGYFYELTKSHKETL